MSRGKAGAHFSLGTNAERLPGEHALARRRPLERSANFGDCLVAIFVQFLELLLQHPQFSGTLGRPFPINIESVGRRWTGRRSLQRLPAPLASMCRDRWWKTYLHASQIGIRPNSVRRDFPCGRALALRVCTLQCVVWMPGRGRFGGKRWTAAARAPDNLVFLRTSISTIKMQSTAKLRRYFPLLFSDSSTCHYRIQKPLCRRAAKFAG